MVGVGRLTLIGPASPTGKQHMENREGYVIHKLKKYNTVCLCVWAVGVSKMMVVLPQ